MALALLIPIIASGVAAQHLTLPLINNDEVVNALNSNDPGFQICTAAADFLSSCVAKAGGSDALTTANPISLAACACCLGTTDVAPVYSTCADYLGSEAPQLGSQISVCAGSPEVCRGLGGGGGSVTVQGESSTRSRSELFSSPPPVRSSSTPSPASSPSKIPDETSSATARGSTAGPTKSSSSGRSGSASGSSSGAVMTLAPACTQMVDLFEECTRATPGFTDLIFGEQAYCYCCRTALDGHVTWTDEIDSYASTCRDWAVTITTGEPVTAYDVAKTFATFCEHFSDVCAVSTTAPTSDTFTAPIRPEPTDDTTTPGGQVTVTVTQGPASTTSGNAAPTIGMAFAAGALAVAGFAVML
ncbi:hypothetical protein TARUN_9666 [Trichoderma arundinaceum]|uniref:Uncharacterized protein n=1 Tax=Trichoderma arundinaceum TaxID=490622 RepID=A0A395N8Y7_TRIAR|nr:hypothetical protein TARUN_9666 [Trichoderma arundinaceum]